MRVPKISRTLTLDRILALSSYSRPNMAVLSQARPIVVLSRPIVVVLSRPIVVLSRPFVVLSRPFVVLPCPIVAVLSHPIMVLSRPIVAVPYLLSPSSTISYSVLQGRLFFFLPATSSPVSLVSVVPRYSVTLIPNEQKWTETISPLIRPPPLQSDSSSPRKADRTHLSF